MGVNCYSYRQNDKVNLYYKKNNDKNYFHEWTV